MDVTENNKRHPFTLPKLKPKKKCSLVLGYMFLSLVGHTQNFSGFILDSAQASVPAVLEKTSTVWMVPISHEMSNASFQEISVLLLLCVQESFLAVLRETHVMPDI